MNNVNPVFIVGGSRTGSEMLKTMLGASSSLDFVDELFLFCPAWLHKDLQKTLTSALGRQWGDPARRTSMLDLLYSGRPYGWFWQNAEEQLDRHMLEEAIADRTVDMRQLFDAIMTVHARMRGKQRLGAKFPMHYSVTHRLLEWYPKCKIIHTTRNPKAVYASQSAKYLEVGQGRAYKAFQRFQQFVHINIQTTWTARLHRSLRSLPNYRLVRYEDVVTDTHPQVESICRFLDVPFQSAMLEPYQYGSSFESIGSKSGVEQSSLDRWRSTISPVTAKLIDWLHPAANTLLGYSADGRHSGSVGRSI